MERKLVTVRRVREIEPIDGADKIELAHVDGWQCVVKKGEFRVGDLACYFEIDSLLPMVEAFEFLKPRGTKKMMVDQVEREGYRLRTVRLKGKLSQGLLLPLSSFKHTFDSMPLLAGEGEDVTERVGVIKYEQPIPAQLQGMIKGNFPDFLPKTDQERVQNLVSEVNSMVGSTFEVTEKLDGSSMTVYFKDGEFGVCSRNLELKESEGNTFWRVAREMDLEARLRRLGRNFALQGELVGPGIQGNPYRLSGATCYFFNVFGIDARISFGADARLLILTQLGLHEKMVPVISNAYSIGQDSLKELLELADGNSLICPAAKREGIVLNSNSFSSNLFPSTKPLNCVDNEPFHFKVISNSFLLDEE